MDSKQIIRIVLICGMLFTGSINTLAKKWQNDCQAVGLDGKVQNFDQPWTQTLFMYSGEALCIFAFIVVSYKERSDERKRLHEEADYTDKTPSMRSMPNTEFSTNSYESDEAEASPLLPDDVHVDIEEKVAANQQSSFFSRYPALKPFLFLMTSSFDLFGTTLSGIGLLYVPASVYQMLRGSIIIFTGILSVLFLKRKLYGFHWVGILTTSLGLVFVGISSIFAPSDTGNSTIPSGTFYVIMGNVLIIMSQLASAVQFIIEEVYVKKHKFPALQVVGMEGWWGILMMVFYVLPICFFIPGNNDGSYENAFNAFYMMEHNWVLTTLVVTYIFSIAFYNYFGLKVAHDMTSVHRTFIDTCRTIIVWGVEIFLYYVTSGKIGQAWEWESSLIELFGFSLLVLGTVIYNAVFKIPRLYYPTKAEQEANNQKTE